jgi:hypothetical protein
VGDNGEYDDLEDTITVPRLPYVAPLPPLPPELNDTFVPERQPPALVEPELRPAYEQPSGIELAPDRDTPPEPQSVLPAAAVASAISAHATPPTIDTVPIDQPAALYFRFRIGSTVVWLDIEAYVGRRPSSPRIISGRMPRLVRVPSPGQEVSSTHIEVRQLGTSVVVTDMRSTNGSIVFPPGGAPRKLRQGESVVVSPGTLVDIGDGNLLEILPLELKAQGEVLAHVPERGRE